eukprot:IDg9282t1
MLKMLSMPGSSSAPVLVSKIAYAWFCTFFVEGGVGVLLGSPLCDHLEMFVRVFQCRASTNSSIVICGGTSSTSSRLATMMSKLFAASYSNAGSSVTSSSFRVS